MAVPVSGPNTVTSASPGTSVVGIDINQAGGYIVNPMIASDQGVAEVEPLFVNQVTTATLQANGTTIALQPGQSYSVIPNTTTPVTVSAPSPNHQFTAVQWASP